VTASGPEVAGLLLSSLHLVAERCFKNVQASPSQVKDRFDGQMLLGRAMDWGSVMQPWALERWGFFS
jgi:hypothetical protein